MAIEISDHARNQMGERGVTLEEVHAAIEEGESEPTRKGRVIFRKNFGFNSEWRGRHYRIKQVAPVVAQEADRLVVVTVYAFYF
jgi:hypothetical protein